MLIRRSAPVLTAIMLALSAGAAVSASAQVRDPANPNRDSSNPGRESNRQDRTTDEKDNHLARRDAANRSNTVDFRSSSWLSDRTIINNNQEEIAEVTDLILDRGSGRIEYLIIETGSTLGMSGRDLAIPYSSFMWEARDQAEDRAGDQHRFVLAATPEQLAQYPEYTPESWKSMKDAAKDDRNTLRQRLALDASAANDPYAGNLGTAVQSRVEGKITNVERMRMDTYGEQVVITVETPEGTDRKVALGPSWYVNGSAAAPMRGDKVVIETLALPRDPGNLLAARSYRSGDRELELRDARGVAGWALPTTKTDKQMYSTEYTRYLLLSDLDGAKIDCRGSECGKVHDIILDRNSGEIAFISIDPNQNFLGMGDTKRLLPWSVATVMLDGTVRIDASKEMVLASLETPSDLATLNTGTSADRVYKAYQVPSPRFAAPQPISAGTSDTDNAWGAQGAVIRGIERDSTKTLSGKIVDITEVTFANGTQPASAIRVRLDDSAGAEELVLLGPASYMAHQNTGCKAGDAISIEACRANIDGQRYWLAKSLNSNNSQVVFMNGNNEPAWTQR